MSNLEALEARIDRLESHNKIVQLATAYAVACDEHDMDRLINLFTENAIFDSPSGFMKATGRKEIFDIFVEMFKIRGPGYHWTHDVCVHINADNPDSASGTVYSHAETCPNDVVSIAAMRYRDEYQREEGVWRFSLREISFLYYVPFEDFDKNLISPNRLYVGGEWLEADYPEKLSVWKAFEASYKNKN